MFKIKTGYKLELLWKGSTGKVITNDKIGGNVPKLEIVMLPITIINKHEKNFWRFYLISNMEKLIIIVPPSLTLLKATNAEFSFTEVLFTDQNNRQLEIEDNMNIFLIIGTG